jgi:hypothetical protein
MTSWTLTATIAVALIGCGSGTSEPSEPAPSVQIDAPVGATGGGEGAICRVGERHPPGEQVEAVECASGMQCCYPCGIPGCDSVCMTDCGPPRP